MWWTFIQRKCLHGASCGADWCSLWSMADDALVKPQEISLFPVFLATSAQHICPSRVAFAAWDAAGGAATTALRLHVCLRVLSPHK